MAKDICILLGERIRILRKQRGWRQIDLAQHSGVHEVHISDVERGAREVGLRTLLAIAQALEVKLSDLFMGINDSI
jgi:XRE family aerobic/anaerobic benzoate catabolism transcriptional regulator